VRAIAHDRRVLPEIRPDTPPLLPIAGRYICDNIGRIVPDAMEQTRSSSV
jgi:hypothetical protein